MNFRVYFVRRYHFVFFGSDEFSCITLKHLSEIFRKLPLHILSIVTTSDDCPVYRLHSTFSNSSDEIYVWRKRKNPLNDSFWKVSADLGIVSSFGRLIPSGIIDVFRNGIVNVHPSILPRWKGPAPVKDTILHGDSEGGVTLMRIRALKFDHGEILIQKRICLSGNEDRRQLLHRLALVGNELLDQLIFEDLLRTNKLNPLPYGLVQSSDGTAVSKKLKKSDSIIDWNSMSSRQILRMHRAFGDVYKLKCYYCNIAVNFNSVRSEDSNLVYPHNDQLSAGSIHYDLHRSPMHIWVRCMDDGWIGIDSILIGRSNRRLWLTPKEFYNGYLNQRKDEQRFT